MAHQKKKPQGAQLGKIALTNHKKEFLQVLKKLCDACCGEGTYSQIPHHIIEETYRTRVHSFKFIEGPGQYIPKCDLRDMKDILIRMIKLQKITIEAYGITLSLIDYFSIGMSLNIVGVLIKKSNIPNAEKISEDLFLFIRDMEILKLFANKLGNMLQVWGFLFSNLDDGIYWYDHTFEVSSSNTPSMANIIMVYNAKSEIIPVNIDGNVRPAKRIGLAMFKTPPKWVTINPSVLNINGPLADTPIKVCIQSHAIQRLSERIDCIDIGILHLNLNTSLYSPKVVYNKAKNLLIEYRIFESKVGYFKADIVDGVLILRTFLFITNSGTPEGEKLEKITGLKKLDRQYLNIDKLSTFMHAGFGNDPEIRKIFENAGCQSLFDIFNKVSSICRKLSEKAIDQTMLAYLENQPFMVEPEPEALLV